MECKYLADNGICVNVECPCCASYCPCTRYKEICKYAEENEKANDKK